MTNGEREEDPPVEQGRVQNETDKERKREVPAWLEITGGVLAVLAFVGLTDFQQVTRFMGWTHASSSASASPSPSLPPIPPNTGPSDPEDVATCTSTVSDIREMQSSVPGSSATKAQFYSDESTSFYGLGNAAVNINLKLDLAALQIVTAKLVIDYKAQSLNDPANDASASDLLALSGDESKVEAFCSQNAGVAS